MVIAIDGTMKPVTILDHNMVEYSTDYDQNFFSRLNYKESLYDQYEDSYQENEVDDEVYYFCNSLNQFIKFCKYMGFRNEMEFYEINDISYEDVRGKWFNFDNDEINILEKYEI